MEVIHKRCAGLDCHSAMVQTTARVDKGRRVERVHERLGTTTPELLRLGDWLTEHGCTHVLMEATGVYWKPIWHVLEAVGGFDLLLARPNDVKAVSGRKSDENDADWLAELAATSSPSNPWWRSACSGSRSRAEFWTRRCLHRPTRGAMLRAGRRRSVRAHVKDPREVPNYGLAEAAHYVRLPVATLRSWVRGRPYPTRAGERWFEPLIEPALARPLLLSFTNLVEAHVLSAIRRQHEIRLDRVRPALEYVRERLGVDRPLAREVFHTDGLDLFVRKFGELINASRSGQRALRDVVEAYLRRIERDEAGLAARFYPFSRLSLDAPHTVVIDPRRGFGRPILKVSGVATSVVAERFKAGESLEDLAGDYSCSALELSEAIRFELPEAA